MKKKPVAPKTPAPKTPKAPAKKTPAKKADGPAAKPVKCKAEGMKKGKGCK